MTIEMIRGTKTLAVGQPELDPDVTEKMKRITATNSKEDVVSIIGEQNAGYSLVRIDTPNMSKLFHLEVLGSRVSSIFARCGIRKTQTNEIGRATIATNQNTHDQLAN